jgi:hypothetical protein
MSREVPSRDNISMEVACSLSTCASSVVVIASFADSSPQCYTRGGISCWDTERSFDPGACIRMQSCLSRLTGSALRAPKYITSEPSRYRHLAMAKAATSSDAATISNAVAVYVTVPSRDEGVRVLPLTQTQAPTAGRCLQLETLCQALSGTLSPGLQAFASQKDET